MGRQSGYRVRGKPKFDAIRGKLRHYLNDVEGAGAAVVRRFHLGTESLRLAKCSHGLGIIGGQCECELGFRFWRSDTDGGKPVFQNVLAHVGAIKAEFFGKAGERHGLHQSLLCGLAVYLTIPYLAVPSKPYQAAEVKAEMDRLGPEGVEREMAGKLPQVLFSGR